MAKVMIGIQARSGSKRLPGKSLKILDDRRMIEHVLSSAGRAAGYINRTKTKETISTSVVLLIPKDDPIKEHFPDEIIHEGSETNVFSRYFEAMEKFKADYVVRVTGDCPLIIPTIISKHVFCALAGEFDYLTNTIAEIRTYVDGYDCEVISRKLMEYTAKNIKEEDDLEHVTTFFKKKRPDWAKFGVVMAHTDLSHIKLSVDSADEFKEVERVVKSTRKKFLIAKENNYHVFRF
jgi:spore coat polysaccharide biosynthesis protein SpsF (cytidylyltransferase family)